MTELPSLFDDISVVFLRLDEVSPRPSSPRTRFVDTLIECSLTEDLCLTPECPRQADTFKPEGIEKRNFLFYKNTEIQLAVKYFLKSFPQNTLPQVVFLYFLSFGSSCGLGFFLSSM